jgi:Ferritin-like domain
MTEFWSSTQRTRSAAELESTIEKAVGKTGLMLFVAFDHGAVISKTTGRGAGRIMRFVIANLLIMKEMAKHVPDAGSYAPVKLNQLLADTMTLLDLYKKSHWQVAGPTFYQLHLLFDKHYDEHASAECTSRRKLQTRFIARGPRYNSVVMMELPCRDRSFR